MPSPLPITPQSADFIVGAASGPIHYYWWYCNRDSDGQLVHQDLTPYWRVTINHYQVGDEPFVLSAQSWGEEMWDVGKQSPYSDVYQFVTPLPVPEPSGLLWAGLVGLALLGRKRWRR